MQFFLSSCRIHTMIWMHGVHADKAHGENAWRHLHKKAMSHIEQILAATSRKTAANTVTYLPSLKPFGSDKQNIRDTAGEVRASS